MNNLDLFYYKLLSEFEKQKAKRSFLERTIFDFKGKKMRRKLEKGYLAGINNSIRTLKRVKKDFDKLNAEEEVEYKERAFIQ